MLMIKSLNKTYGNGVKALCNIDLTIQKGMFGLLGPNGAGKSSLMRTLASLQTPDSGSIEFNGVDVLAQPQLLRQQLGYLPQEFGVYAKTSALKLLDYLAVLKGINNKSQREAQVIALLHQTNLYQHRHNDVATFSGGMRQRFGIAQALLGDPKLIIVDEPTAGLDPLERNRFNNLLCEIGENVVVILSTHIVDDVQSLCPDMAILAQGQIQQQGSPATLVANLKNRVWLKSISSADLPQYQQNFNVLSTQLFSGKVNIHVLADNPPDNDFTQVNASLEDVYFSTLNALSIEEATC
ncbi:MAG: ABC transporter ATP-binding protein [Algicola sp.]|nr:ABC transporter ATP-binding protein [Algicola sp.]